MKLRKLVAGAVAAALMFTSGVQGFADVNVDENGQIIPLCSEETDVIYGEISDPPYSEPGSFDSYGTPLTYDADNNVTVMEVGGKPDTLIRINDLNNSDCYLTLTASKTGYITSISFKGSGLPKSATYYYASLYSDLYETDGVSIYGSNYSFMGNSVYTESDDMITLTTNSPLPVKKGEKFTVLMPGSGEVSTYAASTDKGSVPYTITKAVGDTYTDITSDFDAAPKINVYISESSEVKVSKPSVCVAVGHEKSTELYWTMPLSFGGTQFKIVRTNPDDTTVTKMVKYSDIVTQNHRATFRYRDKGLEIGKNYTYTISAYNETTGKYSGEAQTTVQTGYIKGNVSLNAKSSEEITTKTTTTLTDTSSLLCDYKYLYFNNNGSMYSAAYTERRFDPDYNVLGMVDPGSTVSMWVRVYDPESTDTSFGWSEVSTATTPSLDSTTPTLKLSGSKINVTWPSVKGASKYVLYRSNALETLFSKNELINTTGTSYTDTDIIPGMEYTYSVKAVSEDNVSSNVVWSEIKVPDSSFAAPVINSRKITSGTDGNARVALSWTSVTGATSYRVYKMDLSERKISRIAVINGTTYVDEFSPIHDVAYMVTAYNSNTGVGSTYSNYVIAQNEALADDTYLCDITSVQDTSSGVEIQWEGRTIAGYSGLYSSNRYDYYVYRSKTRNGDKQLVDVVNAGKDGTMSVIDNTAKSGVQYYYSVELVYVYKGSWNDYEYINNLCDISIDVPRYPDNLNAPSISSVKAVSGGISVTWNSVPGATSYRVYRADSANGSKTMLKAVTSTAYTDTTAKAGNTYYYFVAAYNGSSKIQSDYSKGVSGSITVLKAPAISSISTDGKSVTLAWNAVSGATSYRVYRADSATGAKTQLKVRTSPSFTDTTVTAGKTYYYFVAAYDANSGALSAYSAGKSIAVKAALAAPAISSISTDGKSVTLAWNSVSGATSYRVYRADSATGAKTQLKVRTSPNFTDTTVTAGKTYYYFVAAYDANSGALSAYSAGKSIAVKAALAAPAISSISTDGKSVTLAWNAVSGATSYRVYRADSATGAKTQLKVRTSPNYTDTTVTAGKTYYYFVAAYDANSGALSAYSAGKSVAVKAALAAPSITSISSNGKSVTLAWNTVDGATSYRVYRADSATGAKTQLKVRTSPNYTDTTVTAGKTYYYFVAAYDANNSVLSAYSAGKSVAVKAALAAPSITSISSNGKSVTLAWNTVDGATSYRVYRADSANGTKTQLKVRTSPNYTDTTVTAGKTYYYFVAAYDANNSVLSAYSVAKNIVVE